MTKIFQFKNTILAEFIEICNKNSLWYSLDNYSLLSLVNDLEYWNETDHHEVFMTFESYEKLKNLYPNKVLDSVKYSDYFSLQNKFVYDIFKINDDCPFININIIIPSSISRIKKFFKNKNKIKSFSQFYSTINYTNIPKIKNKITLSKFVKPFLKSINYKDINEYLYDEKYEGFIITSPIINNSFLKKWLTNTDFHLRIFEKDGMKINVINEYKNYLKNVYGNKWNEIKNIEIDKRYINVKNIIKYEAFDEKEN
ncbi:hypothetical protein [Metamycoplasma gateae]|uniref:Lipopolysaccharide cholinephosphotransferase n=1 Tax=Metamycoplasma gateae TaxID=35769 RepID=A0ABZ2AI02_9BACT|nr:hypothetical protein V2E26_00165 [Metamycoplasma gateae]